MTQESFVWVVGLIAALLTGILGFSGLLPLDIEKWLRVIAALLAIVSAYLKNSPLPRTLWTPEQRAQRTNGGVK